MKNKEEPSSGLSRGNHRTPGEPSLPDSARMRTTGSTVRSDDAATASLEKPALSLFPMSLTEALVEPSNIEQAWNSGYEDAFDAVTGNVGVMFAHVFGTCWL